MAITPSTWSAREAITAEQLNADLYAYVPGNNHYPNGILFHSTPPMLLSNLTSDTLVGSQPSSSAGSVKDLWTGSVASPLGEAWRCSVDNALQFGVGSDFIGLSAAGKFLPQVNGSDGVAVLPTGTNSMAFYLVWTVVAFAATAHNGGSGAAIDINGVPVGGGFGIYGGIQRSSTTTSNAAYALDLILIGFGNAETPCGYCSDTGGGSFAYEFNANDYTGSTCLFGALWAGPSQIVGVPVASSLPVPVTGYTSLTQITASELNGNALAAPLTFINNVPQLRQVSSPTTSIPNSASPSPTLVPIAAGGANYIDNWSGWNSGASAYTAPVSGVYLVHGIADFTASTAGSRAAGIQINGGLTLWGPGYQAAGSGTTAPQVTRLIDLNAGDVVTLVTAQNSGGALALTTAHTGCRLIVKWMASLASSSGSVAWTPPQTGFRWQAGTPAGDLPALFNAHLANDLSFLLQRPYLLSYQSVAQTGLAQNGFRLITMDQAVGRVHGSAGDNYGGWVSGATNKYVAVVPGWYFTVATYIEAAPTTVSTCLAGIGYFTASGSAQGTNPQGWGQQVSNASANYAAGAEAIGLFYLRAGDYLQPYYQQQNGPATFATSVAVAGQESSFGCVWVSE